MPRSLPLCDAVRLGDIKKVRCVFKQMREDINDRDAAGMTALHYAVKDASVPIVRLLLRLGADPVLPERTPQADGTFRDGWSSVVMAGSLSFFAQGQPQHTCWETIERLLYQRVFGQ